MCRHVGIDSFFLATLAVLGCCSAPRGLIVLDSLILKPKPSTQNPLNRCNPQTSPRDQITRSEPQTLEQVLVVTDTDSKRMAVMSPEDGRILTWVGSGAEGHSDDTIADVSFGM